MNNKFKYDLRIVYLSGFFIMLMFYGLNKVLIIAGVKLFYLMIPMLFLIYFVKYEFVVSKGVRIILIFLFTVSMSIVNTMIFHIDVVGHCFF